MAARGFVAAIVQFQAQPAYNCACNGSGSLPSGDSPAQGVQLNCSGSNDGLYDDARGIFDSSLSTSAISRIVAQSASQAASRAGHGKARIASGVAITGFSQGAQVGRLAATWLSSSIKGAYFLGIGHKGVKPSHATTRNPTWPYDIPCMRVDTGGSPQWTRIPGSKMRAFMGSKDGTYIGSTSNTTEAAKQLAALTNLGDGGTLSFTTGSASDAGVRAGWAVVVNGAHMPVVTGTTSAQSLTRNANWLAAKVGYPAVSL